MPRLPLHTALSGKLTLVHVVHTDEPGGTGPRTEVGGTSLRHLLDDVGKRSVRDAGLGCSTNSTFLSVGPQCWKQTDYFTGHTCT